MPTLMGMSRYLVEYSQPLGDRDDVLGREAEMLEQILGDAGGAERVMPTTAPRGPT